MEYELIRSKRKTLSMKLTKQLKVVVRAPLKMAAKDIDRFVGAHQDWIEQQKKNIVAYMEAAVQRELSAEEISALKRKAKIIMPEKVSYYAGIMGVSPTGVKITSANTRWGSCSNRNSLCFTYKLVRLAEHLIDYVVVHELAHIRYKNHSKLFYMEIEKYMPDYKARIKELRQIYI